MEDDHQKNNDDSIKGRRVGYNKVIRIGENKDTESSKRLVATPGLRVQGSREDGHPPQQKVGQKTSHMLTLSPDRYTLLDRGDPQDRSHDNLHTRCYGYSKVTDNIPLSKPLPTTITVNGVPLKDFQKIRRQGEVKKTTPSKRKLKTGRKNKKTTMPFAGTELELSLATNYLLTPFRGGGAKTPSGTFFV